MALSRSSRSSESWISWFVVHIYYLAGFKNRLFVTFQWALSYFTYGRGARLIVGKDWRFYLEDRGGTGDGSQRAPES